MSNLSGAFANLIKTKHTGLAVLEVPTGDGKTFSAVQAITQYIREYGADASAKHLYFISPQLKNLPKEAMSRNFPKNSEEFDFLVLEKNRDGLCNHLEEVRDGVSASGRMQTERLRSLPLTRYWRFCPVAIV